ncbi:helix-turn-helix domain-containing protein [Paraliobacillus ryukyuensis]|uniref:helix-turn-helix domain-containing protein n=1 Tax=Paraliobacillus ryukyuensis TaxID=200904 RepID=UPI0009A780ED|nr:helix-turn-helix transcriptional regulator [Paraliobacillus ryukyuensis]
MDVDIRKLFSERLMLMRRQKNLTQENLANILDVSKGAISKYEKGTASPSYKILWRLADYFNVSVDYLIGKSNSFSGDRYEDAFISQLKQNFEEMKDEDKKQLLKILRIIDSDKSKLPSILKILEKDGDEFINLFKLIDNDFEKIIPILSMDEEEREKVFQILKLLR